MNIYQNDVLIDELKRAISDLGFVKPTPIQEKTVPIILESEHDLIALAQTGTGKTAGFGLPILQQIDTNIKNVQAIVLSPTRELALQIANDLENYSKYLKDIKTVAVYGGSNIEIQMKALKKGAQIVVGTPGRTLDLIKRKSLKINNINWLVLDEADEMLNMGFREELDAILENTPEKKQTLLFSATMPDGVRQIADNYLNEPEEITVAKKNIGAENVEHYCYTVKASNRYLALKRLADYHPNIYGIIFCRTRRETKDVAGRLIDDGYNADALHGDLSQAQRDYVMQRFRTKQLQLLVATDVAARGLDIDELTHIINYNLPDDSEVYVHRSGRTGRAGRKGVSIIITHSREGRKIRDIEKIVGKKFENKKVPQGEEICEKRLYNLMDKIENIVVDEEKISPYLPAIMKKLEWLDRDELLKRFVFVEFERFLDYYKDAKDLNISKNSEKENKKSRSERRKNNKKDYARIYINIGSNNNLKAVNLLGLVNETTNSNDINIGRIDIQRNFSFFEVEKKSAETVVNAFKGRNYGNVKLNVEIAKELPKDERKEKKNRNEKRRKDDKNERRKRESKRNDRKRNNRRR